MKPPPIQILRLRPCPLTALQTATVDAADLMGWTGNAGSLDAGKWAGVIAVEGDPLKDLTLTEHVKFVMKGGVIYKDEAHPTALDQPVKLPNY